jgi:hypothetical protein
MPGTLGKTSSDAIPACCALVETLASPKRLSAALPGRTPLTGWQRRRRVGRM